MHSDHLHPGSSRIRDAATPPMRTISTVVLSGVRVSSGDPKSPIFTPGISASFAWRSALGGAILNRRCGRPASDGRGGEPVVGPPLRAAAQLAGRDRAEQSVVLVVRSGGEEEHVRLPVVGAAVAELERPQ